jgi:predicted Fe-Mo cluster-binding NifX family protein
MDEGAANGRRLATVKIAFPTRDDQTISGHFGKMKAFVVIDIVNGVEVDRERRDMSEMPACGNGHQEKTRFAVDKISDCDVLIAGGMGIPMHTTATEAGLEIVLTRERLIAKAIQRYANGTLTDETRLAHEPR